MTRKVSLIKGPNRKLNITKALRLIEDDIAPKIRDSENILIKPNFVHTNIPLSATHVDAVRAILDFIFQFTDQKITIGEIAAMNSTEDGFKNYGFLELPKEYNVELVDLNFDPLEFTKFLVYDKDINLSIPVRVSRTILQSDLVISPAMLKTHNEVIATLGIKNIVVGAIKQEDKMKIHQGYRAINETIALLATKIPIDLVVIDGLEGMEGEGPGHGGKVEMNVALAGIDPLAVDVIGTSLMGFMPDEIGYLSLLGKEGYGEFDTNKISILGDDFKSSIKHFRPHASYKRQQEWK